MVSVLRCTSDECEMVITWKSEMRQMDVRLMSHGQRTSVHLRAALHEREKIARAKVHQLDRLATLHRATYDRRGLYVGGVVDMRQG